MKTIRASTDGNKKPKKLPEITQEEGEAFLRDWEDDMLGDDAEYFRNAGIDDIGCK